MIGDISGGDGRGAFIDYGKFYFVLCGIKYLLQLARVGIFAAQGGGGFAQTKDTDFVGFSQG